VCFGDFSWIWLGYKIAWSGSVHRRPVIQNGGRKTGICNISKISRHKPVYLCFYMLARYKISAATLTFLGSGMSMALVGLLQDKTGHGKPKMATSKMELVICQLLDDIETKFRRLDLHFRGPAFEWDKSKNCLTKPEVENSIWRSPNRKYLYLRF